MAEVELLGLDEIDDIDDLAEQATFDPEDIPPEAYSPFPDDYVIGICSLRGTGKSALLAYYCLNGLDEGEKIYTNLPLYPERAGIKNVPNPLELDKLLAFDPELNKAVIAIEELHTWYQKKRPMSTVSIMADEWLRQIRKNVLRVIFTDQSISLPRDVERDVDMFIGGIDLRWTEYGREHNVPRGTQFLYQYTDWSSRLSGRRYNQWQTILKFGNRLWRLFDSYKAQDPFQAFKKYKIVGGEIIYDMDKKKIYKQGELEAEIDEETLERRFMLLQSFWRSFEVDLYGVAIDSGAVINDLPNRLELSVEKLKQGISQLRGNKRQAAERQFNNLKLLTTGKEMAQYQRGRKVIELVKPFMIEPRGEADYE